ncbi:MAG: hypothetical protein RLO21_04850, partial [Nitratireductor sp.]
MFTIQGCLPSNGIWATGLVSLGLTIGMTNPSIAQEPYFSFSDLDEFNGQINDSWFGYRNDVEQVLIQSAGKAFMFDWGFGPSESFRTFVLDARILADDEGFSLIGLFCCQSDDNAAYPGVVMDSSGTI